MNKVLRFFFIKFSSRSFPTAVFSSCIKTVWHVRCLTEILFWWKLNFEICSRAASKHYCEIVAANARWSEEKKSET